MTAAPGQSGDDGLRVAPEFLTVSEIHFGSRTGYYIEVSHDFEWPSDAEGAPIEYAVLAQDADGEDANVVDVLRADQRFAVIFMPPGLAQLLELAEAAESPEAAPERAGAIDALIEQLEELEFDERERALALVEGAEIPSAMFGAPEALWPRPRVAHSKLTFTLEPRGMSVLRQELPPPARRPTYEWGTVILEPDDPCFGKTPEQCVRDKLEDIRRRICEAENADGTPRFPDECDRLSTIMSLVLDPPQLVVLCGDEEMGGEHDGTVTGGFVDPLTGTLTLNGDRYLTDPCADGFIIHEIQHAIEVLAGDYPTLRWYHRLAERLEAIRERLRQATTVEEYMEAAREQRLVLALMEAVRNGAGRDMLTAECEALFATIEAGDLLGFPGAGDAWMEENIKNMVNQLAGIMGHFELPMRETEEMCRCITRIRDWVQSNPTMRARFRASVARQDPAGNDITWLDTLEMFKRFFCND